MTQTGATQREEPGPRVARRLHPALGSGMELARAGAAARADDRGRRLRRLRVAEDEMRGHADVREFLDLAGVPGPAPT